MTEVYNIKNQDKDSACIPCNAGPSAAKEN